MKRWLGVLLVLSSIETAAADPALDALVAAYPDHLAGYEGKSLIWRDGTRMAISDGSTKKSFQQMLDHADIKDQFAVPYRLGAVDKPPALNEDPGRLRNEAFFLKMYGDCRNGAVVKALRPVSWLDGRGGSLMVTGINNVAGALADVSHDLEVIGSSMIKYLVPSAGTYNCRPIAQTERLSVHAFGAAIDINARFSDYWLWAREKDGSIRWRNRVPAEIVDVFERHGFIWGGKWYHFDTMHFEYRPEIIALAKQGWPER